MPGLESLCTASIRALGPHQFVVKKYNQKQITYCTKGVKIKGLKFHLEQKNACVCPALASLFDS